MNESVRKVLLTMSLIIVIVIFVDLIFNFSGLRMTKNNITEQFQSVAGQSYNSGGNNEGNNINNMLDSEDYDHRNIKSIVAKNDGRMFNIMFLPNDNENKTICVSSPVSKNANITVNSNGTISQELKMTSKTNQQFLLLKITNGSDYSNILGNNPLGANEFSADTKYPFYIVKSVQLSNWCLAYEPGKLFLSPVGNYSNQKWDVSNFRNPSVSILTHNVNNTNIGGINSSSDGGVSGEINDPNKIKINFNLTDELKDQLFGLNGDIPFIDEIFDKRDKSQRTKNKGNSSNYLRGGKSGQSNGSCPTEIPKDSITSLCRGCDVDRL